MWILPCCYVVKLFTLSFWISHLCSAQMIKCRRMAKRPCQYWLKCIVGEVTGVTDQEIAFTSDVENRCVLSRAVCVCISANRQKTATHWEWWGTFFPFLKNKKIYFGPLHPHYWDRTFRETENVWGERDLEGSGNGHGPEPKAGTEPQSRCNGRAMASLPSHGTPEGTFFFFFFF